MNKFGRIHRVYDLLHALMLVVLVRLALWALPFKIIRRYVNTLQVLPEISKKIGRAEWKKASVIVRDVIRVSRFVPKATCLTQAIATMGLLKRSNFPAILRIGVARNSDGVFEAHAWVETNDYILIGGLKSELYGKYTLLPSF